MSDLSVRSMREDDLAAVRAIQAQSPEASQWTPSDYLRHAAYVAEAAGHVVGFLVLQVLGEDEAEVLNLVVDADYRRRGVARGLLLASSGPRTLFLEVRESNDAARGFYRSLDFIETGRRRDYYRFPPEDAIVLTRPSPLGNK